jgi:dihydrofolate reductase
MLSFVVAVSQNKVIGRDNALPWHLPEDLKRFKEITMSKTQTMIMGRKTFEALPKILPGRKHIILTRNKDYTVSHDDVEIIYTLKDLNPYIESDLEYFVIGGGEIFKMLLPYTQKMYLTIIHENFQGDTLFPKYDKDEWIVLDEAKKHADEKNKYDYTYLTLERNNK